MSDEIPPNSWQHDAIAPETRLAHSTTICAGSMDISDANHDRRQIRLSIIYNSKRLSKVMHIPVLTRGEGLWKSDASVRKVWQWERKPPVRIILQVLIPVGLQSLDVDMVFIYPDEWPVQAF